MTTKRNARSVTLPLFVVGYPPYKGDLALYDAIRAAANAA